MKQPVEFRDAIIKLDGRNICFAVKAKIEERREYIEIPVYRNSPVKRSLPTFRSVVIRIKRRYVEGSFLHSMIDGNPAELEFVTNGEAIVFSNARIVEWELTGELGGEMMEEITITAESEKK